MKKKQYHCSVIFFVFLLIGCYQSIHKGPAQWDDVYSMEQSIERGVFAGKYYSEPFEYEDSIFKLRLEFSRVYAVYWHWFDEKEKRWKHINDTYIVVEVDTNRSVGIDKLDPCRKRRWQDVKKYIVFDVSCNAIDTINNTIDFKPNECFSDSLTIPITASCKYKRAKHQSEQDAIRFGRLIFKREKL